MQKQSFVRLMEDGAICAYGRTWHFDPALPPCLLLADGKKIVGTLKSVDADSFVVSTQEKQVPEGKKRPVKVDVDKTFAMGEVKSTRYLLNFK